MACVANGEHLVISKNGGEPFSLTGFFMADQFVTTGGAVVGTHAGPGAVGFFWFQD